MRYQEYKQKMMKIRRVLDFFHRFRFVFLGIIVVIVATSITLDVTKGSITSSSDFELSYRYGEKFSYSGDAFMGDVSFEFREVKGNERSEWSPEEPFYAGTYEARAKSKGNHGYKYSAVKKFEILPYETKVSIKEDIMEFGDEKPTLVCSLLNGDRLLDDYQVSFFDLTKNTTKASINKDSLRVLSKDNIDVTACYSFVTEDKDITFNKKKINITFEDASYEYNGDAYSCDNFTYTGELLYGAQIVFDPSEKYSEVGVHKNTHGIRIKTEDGKDYTENYDITVNENSIEITKAPGISIESNSLSKVYDGKKFSPDEFTYEVSGGLLSNIHEVVVTFTNTDSIDALKADNLRNTFTYQILDKKTHEDVSDCYQSVSVSYGTINIYKRNITVQSKNLVNVPFDNTAKYNTDFEIISGELVPGHELVRKGSFTRVTDPGTYENEHEKYVIYDTKTRANVSDNYSINKINGTIQINTLDQLRFIFQKQTFDYDGQSHSVYKNNTAILDPDFEKNLPQGWTAEATVRSSLTMTYYQESGYHASESDVTLVIKNENDEDLTSTYKDNNLISYEFQTSMINKINLDITVSDYEKTYDNKSLGDEGTTSTTFVDKHHLVTSSGLLEGDELKVDYKTSSDKNTKDPGDYSVKLTFSVVKKGTTNSVAQNYNINFVNEVSSDSKDYVNVKINKKQLNVKLKDVSKIYDDNNKIEPEIEILDGNIGDEEISLVNKTYTVASKECNDDPYNPYPYNISAEDIIVKMNNTTVTDKYDINVINTGYAVIKKRDVYVSQTDSSRNFIIFDNKEHGVAGSITNTNSATSATNSHYYSKGDGVTATKEVQVSSQYVTSVANNNPVLSTDGLIINHTISFLDPVTTSSIAVDDGDKYLSDIHNNRYGAIITDSNGVDVTDNYHIEGTGIAYNGYFYINISKNTVTIYTNRFERYFDGEVFKPFENKTFVDNDGYPDYYPIDNYTIKGSEINSNIDSYYFGCYTPVFNEYYSDINYYTGSQISKNQNVQLGGYHVLSGDVGTNVHYPKKSNFPTIGDPSISYIEDETNNCYKWDDDTNKYIQTNVLSDGDEIQIKLLPVAADARGTYINAFDYVILDSDGVTDNKANYNVVTYPGDITVNTATVNVRCSKGEKTYNGSSDDLPTGEVQVTASSSNNGAYIYSGSTAYYGPHFFNNFKVVADFGPDNGTAFYYSDMPYTATPTYKVMDIRGSTEVEYSSYYVVNPDTYYYPDEDIRIDNSDSTYRNFEFTVHKRECTLSCNINEDTGTEQRTISGDGLASGDVLYFIYYDEVEGIYKEEKFSRFKTSYNSVIDEYDFTDANYRVKRNNDSIDVTSCYSITAQVFYT